MCLGYDENENISRHVLTCTSLMNRELFKFPAVEEFPNASNKIFAFSICSANCVDTDPAKKFKRCFEVSVFPDAVSPEIMID